MSNELPLSKEQILDTAEQVLRRFGPDKTSVLDVARALQVSHGTLYRHFSSKASLREAVTDRWLTRSIAEPLADIANGTDGSYSVRLRLWLQTLIGCKRTYASDDPEMFAMYAAVTEAAAEIIEAHLDHLIGQITTIIEGGIRAGEFKALEPRETARAIFLAFLHFHHPAHFRQWTNERIDADFDAVWRLLLGGITSVPSH
ncbi:TetR family transcriptional regulator [Paenibacillus sp. J53TS2]|uniref:TetR family transcriptional regulator n=1 Tax=Paenibacillus sp. J53TS2 TaxID=2807197 RepID=UPI001B1984D2|nr:TetR family transcriptional regulator [Paenibacillus sp. J53TS2]GIP47524.1 TetR family transcriptional regulator [Paenibacillus sp. J53TS2]